jgi:lipase ATG15
MRVFWVSFQFLVLLIAFTSVFAFTAPPPVPAATAARAPQSVTRVHVDPRPIPDKWWHSSIRHFRTDVDGEIAHIFSIRGTVDMIDAMADVELWAASFIMNIMKMTIPIFSGYADDSRYFLGYSMGLPGYMFSNISLINGYVSIAQRVLDDFLEQKEEGANVIFTGHSLGGGLAKILAAVNGYQAVAISGPGISAAEAIYGWKSPHVPNSFINVVPNLDPIAGVDRPAGSTFVIPCEAGVFACHDVWRSQCMLAAVCGQLDRLGPWCTAVLGEDETQKIKDLGDPYSYTL